MKFNKFKKQIVEFVMKYPIEEGIYEITRKDFEKKFKKNINYESNLKTLITNGIVVPSRKGDKQVLTIFEREHQIDLRHILRYEILNNMALKMQPEIEKIQGLVSRFHEHTDQNQGKGVYYFYTDKGDPDCWIVFARLDPKKEPYRYRLGAINDRESKLYKMWLATVQAWRDNNNEPIRRGMAEKLDQNAFGNNRQPGFASFKLFTYAGWLKIPHRNGTSVYYDILDAESHNNSTKLKNFTDQVLEQWGFSDGT